MVSDIWTTHYIAKTRRMNEDYDMFFKVMSD